MDTLLSDTSYLDNLLLEKTISYVQKIGWTQVSHPNQNIILFQYSTDDLEQPVQLVLPSSARFWDSAILLDKAINLLAASEKKSLEEIKAAIQSENNSVKAVESASNPLKEETLLQKNNKLLHLLKRKLARLCGVIPKTNSARINLNDFDDALPGRDSRINFQKPSARQVILRSRVDENGQITIGARHTQVMRLKPSDEFEVKLNSKPILLSRRSNRARQAIHSVSVDKRGQIIIAARYTQAMGLKPGEEFEVKLNSKQILLSRLEDTRNKRTVN